MRAVPLAILTGPTVRCWQVTLNDGQVLRSTELDADVTVPVGEYAGTYRSSTSISGSTHAAKDDLSVGNMEVQGTLTEGSELLVPGISAQDIEAGLVDSAAFVLLLVNWRQPDAGVYVELAGTIGNVQRDSTGNWTCELRSLMQRYQQRVGRSYTVACNVEVFGDARCGVDVDAYAVDGAVLASSGSRTFTVDADLGSPATPAPRFTGGRVRFTSGLNAGYEKEIKSFAGTTVECWEAFPFVVAEGDTLTMWPDCFRDLASCKFYDNVPNHRGFPNLPGPDELIKLRAGPARKGGGGGGK